MVYAWRTDRIGLVVSMDFKNWKAQDGSAIDKFVTVLCSISAHVESSFGLARVNSDYFPLTLGDLHDAVALLHRGSPEPPLLWVHERQIGFLELKTIVAGGRKILQREAYSVVYPTLDT